MVRIVCAANRLNFSNGVSIVLCGVRHFDLLMHKVFAALEDKDVISIDQGFADSKGNFLSREEAFIVSTEANQITQKSGNPNSIKLFSEDLY